MSSRAFRWRGTRINADAARDGSNIRLRLEQGGSRAWETRQIGAAEFRVRESGDGGKQHRVFVVRDGQGFWVHLDGRTYHLEHAAAARREGSAGVLTAPIPGTVTEVLVDNDNPVDADQVVMVISAMKMQLEIKAPYAGVVRGLELAVGDPVEGGRQLLRIELLDNT